MKYFTTVSAVVLLLGTWGMVQSTPIRSNEIMKHAQDLLVGMTGEEDSFSWKEAVASVFDVTHKKMNCNAIKKQHKCEKDSECSWCTGDWFDECFIQEVAKKLPTKHFSCTNLPEPNPVQNTASLLEDDVETKGKGVKCTNFKTAGTCEGDGSCSWCTSPLIPVGICVNDTASNWMPKPFFDCTKGDDDEDQAQAVTIKEEVLLTVVEDDVETKGKVAAKCKNFKTAGTCEGDGSCSWCTSPFIPIGICLNDTASNWMPKPFFDCTKGDDDEDQAQEVTIKEEVSLTVVEDDAETKGKGAAKCKNFKAAGTCEGDGSCSWCTSPLIPIGICVNDTASNWMPKPFFDCTKGDDDEDQAQGVTIKEEVSLTVVEDDVETKGKGAAKCKNFKTAGTCEGDGSCSWCTSPLIPIGICVNDTASNWMPKPFFDCTKGDDDEDQAQAVTIKEEVSLTVVEDDVETKGKGAAKCKNFKTAGTCEGDGSCSWCTSPLIPIVICVNDTASNWMPKPFFDCTKGDDDEDQAQAVTIKEEVLLTVVEDDAETKGKGAAKCKNFKAAGTCEGDGSCSWCTSPFIPIGICLNDTASNWMPKPFFDCTKGNDDEDQAQEVTIKEEVSLTVVEDDVETKGKGAAKCKNFKTAGTCEGDGSCSWCTSPLIPIGICVNDTASNWMPKPFFDCTKGDDDEDQAQAVTIKEEVSLTVVEDDVETKGKGAAKCKNFKTAGTCEGDGSCSWCTSPLIPIGICVNDTASNWMPKPFFDCTKGDDDEDQAQAVTIKEEVSLTVVEDDVETKGKGAAKCKNFKTAGTCEGDGSCSWCTSPFIPIGICLNDTASNWMPKPFFDCTKGDDDEDQAQEVTIKEEVSLTVVEDDAETKGKGAAKCKNFKTAGTCEGDGSCSWCTSPLIPIGICVNDTASNWMPKPFFDCTKGDDDEDQAQAVTIKDQVSLTVVEDDVSKEHRNKTLDKLCKKHKTAEDCSSDAECSWCNGGKKGKWFAKCFSEEEALKLHPKHFECNVTSSPDATAFTLTETLEEVIKVQGSALSFVEDFFKEEVLEEKGGLKCKRHKVMASCDVDTECVWCTSVFGGGKCANATTAEWLPSPIYDCK